MYSKSSLQPIFGSILVTLFLLSLSSGAFAAGGNSGGHRHKAEAGGQGHHDHVQGFKIGEPGKASEVGRTIEVTMRDNRYSPELILVKKGETVRFIIKNKGEFVHEFNIGTTKMHTKHQNEMMVMVEHGVLEHDKINFASMKMDIGGGKTMEHNDPNSALLEPRKSAEILWKFDRSGSFEFACNVPGHYESGMVGGIKVE